MRKVITIPEVTGEKKPSKGIEFTQYLSSEKGWVSVGGFTPQEQKSIVYIGCCEADGDLFAAYSNNGLIRIFKGHLNDGTY